jgi:hypothetical protein
MKYVLLSILALSAACIPVPDSTGTNNSVGTGDSGADANPMDVGRMDLGGDLGGVSADANDAALSRPDVTPSGIKVAVLQTSSMTSDIGSILQGFGHRVLVVRPGDLGDFDVQSVDVIVVPSGEGLDSIAPALKEADVAVVWMNAHWAQELELSTNDDFTMETAQDIEVFEHPLITLAGLDTGEPDYEIYLDEHELPCFDRQQTNSTIVANIADSGDCESFVHVYDSGSPLQNDVTRAPRRRVVLPLEVPVEDWTTDAENLLDASVVWAAEP